MLLKYRKYGAIPDYIDTQSTERKHKESVKAIYGNTSKRKNTFAEEVARGYAKKLKFELLYDAFFRMKSQSTKNSVKQNPGGNVVVRRRQLNGKKIYIPQEDSVHYLCDNDKLNDMIDHYIENEGWVHENVIVKTLGHTDLLDSSRITYGNEKTLCAAVLRDDEKLVESQYVRYFLFCMLNCC